MGSRCGGGGCGCGGSGDGGGWWGQHNFCAGQNLLQCFQVMTGVPRPYGMAFGYIFNFLLICVNIGVFPY